MAGGLSEKDGVSPSLGDLRTPVSPTHSKTTLGTARDITGTTLGDFAIQRRLGSGGMGDVYLAQQISLKRAVAVKVLREDLMADDGYRRRFEAEAMAVAPINHPNVVSVISIGKEQGIHYIAMEYVPGLNLREFVTRKGPAELLVGINIMRKVAAALEQATEHGIVHRDIKPDNILLTKKGDVKVADFGLARQAAAQQVDLTQSGVTMGTPLYMSPEQLEGKPVDVRSDIYSFGILCYHLFTGEPPYRGETALSIAVQHLKSEIPLLSEHRPDLPEDLVQVVARMMAKDPEARFQTPQELSRELTRIKQRLSPAELPVGASTAADSLALPTANLTDAEIEDLAHRGARTTRAWNPRYWQPRTMRIVAALGLFVAAAIGGTLAWREREQPASGLSQASLAERIKEATQEIQPRKDGWIQLLEARTVLAEEDREAGLWAVLMNFKHQEDPVLEAAQELVERYLPRGDYDSALILADTLIACDDPKEKMFGYLVKGIVRSRQGRPEESNRSFLDMMECPEPAKSFEPRQLQWLATQYFLALNLNAQMLGSQPQQRMIDGFWSQFLPKRGVPRPPRSARLTSDPRA